MVRCVRWAFKYVAPDVGKVFFSKHVALPFLRWRMLRHGYLTCPVHWHEYEYGEVSLASHAQSHRGSDGLTSHRVRRVSVACG